MKKILLLSLLFSSIFSFALEMDEKLTVRILSISKTKKTALLNRGLEDGLVVGDHAKLFLTTGVIARAVVVKASPSRSIWSIYRIIESSSLTTNKVMNIKISSPLKLTADSSKSLRPERYLKSDKITIPMAEGANDLPEDLNKEDQADMAGLNDVESSDSYMMPTGFSSKTWELFGLMNMTSLSGTWEQGDNSNTSNSSSTDIAAGVEKYFTSKGFLQNLSFNAFINSRSMSSGFSIESSSSWFEYGVGANYHFYNSPLSYGKIIGFGGVSFGVGTVSYETTTTTTGGGTTTTDPVEGTSNFFSLGGGAKYNLSNGFGARVTLDYYKSGASFEFEDDDSLAVNVGGPRIRMGISYRF
jgi:hypothetical protein